MTEVSSSRHVRGVFGVRQAQAGPRFFWPGPRNDNVVGTTAAPVLWHPVNACGSFALMTETTTSDPSDTEHHRAGHSPAEPPINWPTTLFIVGTTMAALAWPVYAYFFGVTAGEIALAVAYYFITGMSITVGYHRLLAHRSFRANRWVRAALLVAGSAAWQGSALEWCTDHVRHHAHIDTDDDPYNIKRGFLYAHVGWLLRKRDVAVEDAPAVLTEDRLVMWQHKHYTAIAVTAGFIVPLLLAGVGGLLLAGAFRLVVVHHCTWFINSWAHTGSRRPYNNRVSAVDNWFLAFFTFGEGWHNYHHAFPSDYRNGIAAWAWDPSKWTIWSLAKLGAAWDLKRMKPTLVWRRRVESALAYDGSEEQRVRAMVRTRNSLERLRVRSEEQARAMVERVAELRETAHADMEELRARVGHWIDNATHRDSASHRFAERAYELLEQNSSYQKMIERLTAAMPPALAAPA